MKKTLAFFLICMGLQVFAQDIADPQVVEGLNIAEERSKLEMLRKSQAADYSAAKKACYQKLAVTTCLEKARQVKNKQDNEIKRLSLVLNDADRRQKASEALGRIDDKQSPEQQAERESQRADRLKRETDKQLQNKDKNQQQLDKEAEKLSKREAHAKHAQEVLQRRQKHQDKLDEAEQSRANHQRKLEAAQLHREQVQKDSAARTPPAAPLPPRPTPSP
jgi:hypothetical protein